MTLSAMEQQLLADVPTDLLIGGSWRPASSRRTIAVTNPATGAVIVNVADASAEDGLAALASASEAQASWGATPPRERGELLRRAFELLHERAEKFALLMTLEMGKPLAQARGELAYGAEFFRWFSEEAVRVAGRWATAPDGTTRLLTMKQPVGATLAVTPWNFPLAMGTRKIGPAIAAGCTMVVKPASQTPLTMLALAELLREVGVPAGVLNVITTSDTAAVVEAMTSDARLRKLTFTGSTPVGKALVRQSADQLLRVSMELGGNAPFVVFDDADLDRAVEGAMLAKMRNMGEACTAANRFLVHEDIAPQFAQALAERMASETIGPGTDPNATVGPLIDAKQLAKVDGLVTDATDRGARVVCGGERVPGDGYFYRPTVLTDVPDDAALVREEIFGPVAPITTFATEEEALRRANDTEYGLAAYVFTSDLARALRMGEGLVFGMVGINQGVISNPAAPFGGVKQSGFGREGGLEGIDEYLEVKYVGIAP
jgi:succinate-semialdehyde dehydrogenase/glutarate-semialdehyde dehydrogenase